MKISLQDAWNIRVGGLTLPIHPRVEYESHELKTIAEKMTKGQKIIDEADEELKRLLEEENG